MSEYRGSKLYKKEEILRRASLDVFKTENHTGLSILLEDWEKSLPKINFRTLQSDIDDNAVFINYVLRAIRWNNITNPRTYELILSSARPRLSNRELLPIARDMLAFAISSRKLNLILYTIDNLAQVVRGDDYSRELVQALNANLREPELDEACVAAVFQSHERYGQSVWFEDEFEHLLASSIRKRQKFVVVKLLEYNMAEAIANHQVERYPREEEHPSYEPVSGMFAISMFALMYCYSLWSPDPKSRVGPKSSIASSSAGVLTPTESFVDVAEDFDMRSNDGTDAKSVDDIAFELIAEHPDRERSGSDASSIKFTRAYPDPDSKNDTSDLEYDYSGRARNDSEASVMSDLTTQPPLNVPLLLGQALKAQLNYLGYSQQDIWNQVYKIAHECLRNYKQNTGIQQWYCSALLEFLEAFEEGEQKKAVVKYVIDMQGSASACCPFKN